jgi:hypothetical protein
MELLAYDEFSALRLRQFIPPGAKTGWYSCDRKLWRCAEHETFASYTVFCFADEAHTSVSGIVSALEDDWPLDAANALLSALHLPLDMTATVEELVAKLGKPEYQATKPTAQGLLFFRFVVGSRWPYLLGLHVRPSGGLARIFIGRKDMLVPGEEE